MSREPRVESRESSELSSILDSRLPTLKNILIIKHGAFGDIILATAAFKAIRAFYPDAHITVMTTKPFVSLLAACPWIDEVWADERSRTLKELMAKIRAFHRQKYDAVYDLQTSQRSSFYWWLMPWPKPRWSGIATFASHRHHTPHRTRLHTLDRLKEQLAAAGIIPPPEGGRPGGGDWPTGQASSGIAPKLALTGNHPHLTSPLQGEEFLPDISWMQADISRFPLKTPYALLIPGGSAHRPEKRWPAERYAQLVQVLLQQGINSVLIGSEGERDVLAKIEKIEPCVNLCGQTSFEEIAELARGARLAIGNDTGPTHVIAAAGCPVVALFAIKASNPDLCAPKGRHITIIKAEDLFYLPVHDVAHAVKKIL